MAQTQGSSADKTKSSISNPRFLRTDSHHSLHLLAGSAQPPVLWGRGRGQGENTGKDEEAFCSKRSGAGGLDTNPEIMEKASG